MSVGIADHRVTKGSPPCNSNTKTSALTRMMTAVTTERCRGRRDASPSGIMVPMLSSTLAGAGGEPRSTVGSPELEGELPLSGTKRGRGRALTTTPTARGAVDECPTAKETPQPAFRSHHDPEGTRWMVTKAEPTVRLVIEFKFADLAILNFRVDKLARARR